MARLLGASLLPLALFLFTSARNPNDASGRIALWAGFLHNAALSVILVVSTALSTLIWTGWPAAGLHVVLALGCIVSLGADMPSEEKRGRGK
jgi:hypothetical protein